jgi:hypothetical protein
MRGEIGLLRPGRTSKTEKVGDRTHMLQVGRERGAIASRDASGTWPQATPHVTKTLAPGKDKRPTPASPAQQQTTTEASSPQWALKSRGRGRRAWQHTILEGWSRVSNQGKVNPTTCLAPNHPDRYRYLPSGFTLLMRFFAFPEGFWNRPYERGLTKACSHV